MENGNIANRQRHPPVLLIHCTASLQPFNSNDVIKSQSEAAFSRDRSFALPCAISADTIASSRASETVAPDVCARTPIPGPNAIKNFLGDGRLAHDLLSEIRARMDFAISDAVS